VPENDDLQLEFTMLSPFDRLKLLLQPEKSTQEASTYAVSFTLPRQHGIFNFKVNYKRPFLSNIEEKNTVTVRHVAHDEWPRSYRLSSAWPYVASIFVTISGFLAFCAVWLYSAPVSQASKAKKTQ